MLVEVYGEHALGKSQCFEWFKKLSGLKNSKVAMMWILT